MVERQLNQLIDLVSEASSRDQRLRQAFETLNQVFGQAIYSPLRPKDAPSPSLDWEQLIANVTAQEREIRAMAPLKQAIEWIEHREEETPVSLTAIVYLVEAKRDLQQQLRRIKDTTSALYVLEGMASHTRDKSDCLPLRLAATFYGKGGARLNEDANIYGLSSTLQHALNRLEDFSRNNP